MGGFPWNWLSRNSSITKPNLLNQDSRTKGLQRNAEMCLVPRLSVMQRQPGITAFIPDPSGKPGLCKKPCRKILGKPSSFQQVSIDAISVFITGIFQQKIIKTFFIISNAELVLIFQCKRQKSVRVIHTFSIESTKTKIYFSHAMLFSHLFFRKSGKIKPIILIFRF